jgi:hypothetical protein
MDLEFFGAQTEMFMATIAERLRQDARTHVRGAFDAYTYWHMLSDAACPSWAKLFANPEHAEYCETLIPFMVALKLKMPEPRLRLSDYELLCARHVAKSLVHRLKNGPGCQSKEASDVWNVWQQSPRPYTDSFDDVFSLPRTPYLDELEQFARATAVAWKLKNAK